MEQVKTPSSILIIGAGPAGCVAAGYLLQKGYQVTVVEISCFPRFAIGESLLPVSMEHFREAGLLETLKEQNYEVKKGVFFCNETTLAKIYFCDGFTNGWDWAWQVPREDFDDVLARRVREMGAEVLFESKVSGLDFHESGVNARIEKPGQTYDAKFDFVIDSSGNGRVLSEFVDMEIHELGYDHMTVFTRVHDSRAENYEHAGQITFEILEQDLWLWVIPFSNGQTSLGMVGNMNRFDGNLSAEDEFNRLLERSVHFRERFKGLKFELTPQKIPIRSFKADKIYGKNYALAGNCTGFIDPVFSSGVALATYSATRAAKLIHRELSNEEVNWEVEYDQFVKSISGVFQETVNSWYDGHLQDLILNFHENNVVRRQVISILAGYVTDTANPFINSGYRRLKTISEIMGQNH